MKRKLLLTLGCLVGLATLSYGGYAWYNAITYVSTDDAYVEGTISPVSAKVAGHIVELFVQDNQVVKKGELLMRVDPREYDVAESAHETAAATVEALQRWMAQSEREIQQAEAELGNRVHAVDQARQRVVEARAALALAESQIHQVAIKDAEASRAEARLREMQADLAFADLQVEHTQVRAPVEGVVPKRSVGLGQVVQMGQALLAIRS